MKRSAFTFFSHYHWRNNVKKERKTNLKWSHECMKRSVKYYMMDAKIEKKAKIKTDNFNYSTRPLPYTFTHTHTLAMNSGKREKHQIKVSSCSINSTNK